MKRRRFLSAALAAPFATGATSFLSTANAADSMFAKDGRTFEIITRVSLHDTTGPARLWLPLAQTAADYQWSLSLHWQGGEQTEIVHDDCYGAPILRTAWKNDGGSRNIEVVQTVAVRDRTTIPLTPFTEAERRFWIVPTANVPTDGIVRDTAALITSGQSDPGKQLRAIYDWVIDHTYRDPDVPGCGVGNVRQSLTSGKLGGKCADINGLMVGLARAAGFPAREVYGIRVAPSQFYPCLGHCGDITTAQHCRAEVYWDRYGWFPLDPADVRKVILEQKLALDSPEVSALRDRLFGYWEMNWVGYNSAHDIVLPGEGSNRPNFPFLMYPCAYTSQGILSCLDAAHFHYEIASRELTV